jgi:hypothetical protein
MSHKKSHKTHEHITNTTTMVVELPTPPAGRFDESMPPKEWAALRTYCPRRPLKDFNRFNKKGVIK